MGRVFLRELEGQCYKCGICDASLALAHDRISRAYNWRQGRSYLFRNVVNITFGSQEERMMHTIQDIFCCSCGQILGWKYVKAHDKNQRCVEGKFVIEKYTVKHDF